MESLLATPVSTPSAPEPASIEQQRNSGIAFVLSLLLPGAGHIYCRKTRNGLLTMAFFAGALCCTLVLSSESLFWGIAARAALILYVYAFLDAFFVSREINDGRDPYIVGNNPRIAAMLNLLTNGLGYFYLGERKKGLILFIGLRVLSSGFHNAATGDVSRAAMAALELIYIVIAIDAYRLARKQLKQCFPDQAMDAFAVPAGSNVGLSSALPIALAIVISFNYLLLVTIGITLPDYSKLDRSREAVTAIGDGKMLRNPAYGAELSVPAGWEFKSDNKAFLLEAQKLEGACDVAVVPEAKLPFVGLPTHAHALSESIRSSNPAFTLQSERPSTVGGNPAYELLFSAKYNDTEVMQRYVLTRRGLTLYTFIATAATVFADECGPEMQRMQQQITLGR